jgi:hypothetical protein
MPKNVMRFEILAYIAIGIGVIISALEYQRLSAVASPAFVLTIQFFVMLLLVWLIWLTARRHKNWARWVFLILFLVGLPLYIPNLADMMAHNAIAGVLSAAQMLIEGVSLYFVFSGDAKDWFRKPTSGQAA